MARFGGMPGGGGGMDMMKLMKQAQKMQEDAAKLQQDMQAARFEGNEAGTTRGGSTQEMAKGGFVEVVEKQVRENNVRGFSFCGEPVEHIRLNDVRLPT